MNRLALHDPPTKLLEQHLDASAPLEEGAFYLLREGLGLAGRRLLATELLLPPKGAWEQQGTGVLRPSARWLSAVIGTAIEAKAGLLFVHSHPDARHPAALSPVDMHAMHALGATIAPMLDGPFAAAVVHPTGWAGVVWNDGVLEPIDRIVAVGASLRALTPSGSTGEPDPLDARQRDALGVVHDRLRSLNVGVVGCGGLGSPIAEQLNRMGVAALVLVDHDTLDTPSNARRVIGSTLADLNATIPPMKVDVVGRHLDTLGFNTHVTRINADVRSERAFRALLDTDVVMIGTDTHGSRAVVNDLASTYLLPVIDIGIRVGAKANGALSGLTAELRLLTPDRPCLWCRGAINADAIHAENLPIAQRKQLQLEGYLAGSVGAPAPSVMALTVLGAGMATCALLALLSDEADVIPSGYVLDGMFGDAHGTTPRDPKPGCRCRHQLGLGDGSAPPLF
jgi:hypothetical protein